MATGPLETCGAEVGGAMPVRAAGGVVWRRGITGVEVLLVHRPHYDDWTLPKGKLDPGESHEQAALREVAEETGLDCRLGPELGSSAYVDNRGRPKTVRYWAMTEAGGSFEPHSEVDAACWLPALEAGELLSYERDRSVLATLTWAVPPPLLLIRHAVAKERRKWKGPDSSRPLTGRGTSQAEGLVERVRRYRVDRVMSSPAQRCLQTVLPLARSRGLAVDAIASLAEGSGREALDLLDALAGTGSALCTHGDVLELILSELSRRDGLRLTGRLPSAKGSVWILEPEEGRFVATRYLAPR
ncbi:MAG: NUDIX hydrolase [Acidimicrobiales bacterium]